MRHRGYTTVELLVALTLAAIVTAIAGQLLVAALNAWRTETEPATARREAGTALDALARDFGAQPWHPEWPAPVNAPDLDAPGEPVALFVVGQYGGMESVAWVRLRDGSLWRLNEGAGPTATARPANAAGVAMQAALAGDSPQAALEALGARRVARHIAYLHPTPEPQDALEAAQMQMGVVTASGAAAAMGEEGTLDRAAVEQLPGRQVYATARVFRQR